MDARKLRLYKLLLDNNRITLEDIPEPYRTELTNEQTTV
jgi:hypothetical protein